MTGAVTEYHYKAAGGAVPIPGVGGVGGASNTAYVTLDIRIINNETGEVAYAAAERGASNQTLGGLITRYGGFGAGKINGILATTTRKAVIKHVVRAVGARSGYRRLCRIGLRIPRDPADAPARAGPRGAGDQAGPLQAGQGGVEGALGQAGAGAVELGDPPPQLVAVERAVVEEAEDLAVEHRHSIHRIDMMEVR